MTTKTHRLPTLDNNKKKTLAEKNRTKIQDLFLKNRQNRLTHKDYRHQQQFVQVKAANFLSRTHTVESPEVLFEIADQVKQLHHVFIKENRSDKENTKASLEKIEARSVAEQRQQALTLAKWMDEKLLKFKAKRTITFMDILEYKQTILNYALGRIIDSLTKKCREEGQLLSLIWNNTFAMFEGVFNVLAAANQQKEKEKVEDTTQLQEMYQINHNFLRTENTSLLQENQNIFEKMKNVIVWNKKLRRQRKKLHTTNRILQYRNHTYSQALQQTVEMLLRTVPEPATIQTAKKIVKKLAKEKCRKKNFYKKEIDEEFSQTTKEFVYQWLKRNSCSQEELSTFYNECPQNKEDKFILQDIDDWNEMRKVNIYDFFKLYDVGVQTSVPSKHQGCQYEPIPLKNAEVMTRVIVTAEHGCQTAQKHQSKPSIEIQQKHYQSNLKKKGLGRNNKDKSQKKLKERELISNRSERNIKKGTVENNKDLNKFTMRASGQPEKYHDKYEAVSRKGKEDNFSINRKMETNSVAFRLGFEPEDKNVEVSSVSELEDSHTKGMTTKHLITNNSLNSRIRSMRDIYETNGSAKMLVGAGIGAKGGMGLIRGSRRIARLQSLAYTQEKGLFRSVNKLSLHKKFNDAYNENRRIMNDNQQEFYDQIIRRRSFYNKKRVQFSNLQSAEEGSLKAREFLRGRPIVNRQKTMFEQSSLVSHDIEKLTKKMQGPSNIVKTKTLLSSQAVFNSIVNNIEARVRMPPANKTFVSNSLLMISKYIEALIPDYVRQTRREKEELICDYEKVLYPLNVLMMQQMTFKYGLKEIAGRKAKNFIEKVITFSTVSQKVSLYSLLLGLQDSEVGTDELLVYIKSLVYFDGRKAIRQAPSNTESTPADIEIVRQNMKKVLSYFFDSEYVNLIQLKLQIYFQQTAPFSTIEGIANLIIRQLLKRKRQIKQKYQKIHKMCSRGDNFFTNIYKIIKLIANYRRLAEINANMSYNYDKRRQSTDSIQVLTKIKGRKATKKDKEKSKDTQENYTTDKISQIIHELLQRSDIIDEEFGKSITLERFITVAVISGIPTYSELQTILQFFKNQFKHLQSTILVYQSLNLSDPKTLDQIAKLCSKDLQIKQEDKQWTLATILAEHLEDEVLGVMGKVGAMGLYIESAMLGVRVWS